MRSSPIRVLPAFLCAVAVLLAAACGGGSGPTVSVSIDQPEEGTTVASPVAVVLSAEGLEDGAHLHLLVDLPCDEPGSSETAGDQRLRLGVGVEEAELELAPGEHALCAQAADADHVALAETASVAFEVAGAGGGSGTTTATADDGTETWEGTVTGDFQAGPDCTPGVYTGEIVLDVDEKQAVTGEGFTDSSEYTCTTPQGTTTIPATTLQYRVTGTKDEAAFHLEFEDGLTMQLDISGNTATGSTDQSASDTYVSRTTIEVSCTDC